MSCERKETEPTKPAKHSPDPRARSYVIDRLRPLQADAKILVHRLGEEKDVTIRRALILGLGGYRDEEFSLDDRKALLPKLQEIYRADSDPGLHAAAEWLLRTWKQESWLSYVNKRWSKEPDQQGKRLEDIKRLLADAKEKTPPQWHVNGQGQTMVVLPGPAEFMMGSPSTEKERPVVETQHSKRIGRSIADASKCVTLAEYRNLTGDKYEVGAKVGEKNVRRPDLPVVGVNWYMAAKYCNLLSKAEGVDKKQWCYDTDANGEVTRLKDNYLGLTGYRLLTEAELEYATRSGTATSRHYPGGLKGFARCALCGSRKHRCGPTIRLAVTGCSEARNRNMSA
jgi:hypothetical protein